MNIIELSVVTSSKSNLDRSSFFQCSPYFIGPFSFQETFEIALNEHVIHADVALRGGGGGMAVTGEQVSQVFTRIVAEVEKVGRLIRLGRPGSQHSFSN